MVLINTCVQMKRWVFLIILAGFILRIYHLEKLAGMDFDQDIAAWWIKSFLIDHKFSLIGQEISIGGIYIAPLYFYFLSVFYFFFRMDPLAANIAVSLVSVLTMLLVYKIARLLFDRRTAIIALIIYAFSYQINFYDRTTAPSNLIMPLSLTVLYLILKKRSLLLAPVLGLTFSASPAAALLIPQALFFRFKQKLAVFAIILLFVSPLLFFDFRHDFMVTKRIFQVLFSGQRKVDNYFPPLKLFDNLLTLAQSFRQQIFFLKIEDGLINIILDIITGSLGLIFFLKSNFSSFQKKIFLIWLLTPLIFFSFYPFHVPEYYFLPVFPITIIFFAAFLRKKFPDRALVFFFTLFILINCGQILISKYGFSMFYKKQAVKYIVSQAQDQPFKVDYDVWPGQGNGFKYLFYWAGREPSPQAKKRYIITVPENKNEDPGQIFGRVKVITADE